MGVALMNGRGFSKGAWLVRVGEPGRGTRQSRGLGRRPWVGRGGRGQAQEAWLPG